MSFSSIEKLIRDVPDFPIPGIVFKDITPILQDPAAFQQVIDGLAAALAPLDPNVVVGIESRGFIFGAPLALQLKLSYVPVRKVGKLPAATIRETYDLEYGTNAVEIHEDAIRPGDRVVVVDDLLATGGTASATGRLIQRLGGETTGFGFVIELGSLNGRRALNGCPVSSLIRID